MSNLYLIKFPNISSSNYLISLIFNSLSRVSVPLYFMISGSLLIGKKYDSKNYYKRILKFIIILIVWSVIYSLLNNSTFSIKTFLISLFNARSTGRHLWFMYAIIGLYIVLPFIQNMCKNLSTELENLFIVLWMIFSGLGVIYEPLIKFITNSSVKIEYSIPLIQATYYLGYFILGHILYKRIKNDGIKFSFPKYSALYLICTFITVIATSFTSFKLNYHYESMLWYKSVFTILASIGIFNLIINKNYNINYPKVIEYFSGLTFGIYLIHMIFLNIIVNNIDLVNYNSIVVIPLCTLFVFALSCLSTMIIKKIPIVNKLIG